jgi:Ribosomal L38e protein family
MSGIFAHFADCNDIAVATAPEIVYQTTCADNKQCCVCLCMCLYSRDAKSVKIKKTAEVTKFKIRCSRVSTFVSTTLVKLISYACLIELSQHYSSVHCVFST